MIKIKKIDTLRFVEGIEVELWLKSEGDYPCFEAVFPDGEKLTDTDGERIQERIKAEIAHRMEPLTWVRCIEVRLRKTSTIPYNIAGLTTQVLDIGVRSDGVPVQRTVTFLNNGQAVLSRPQHCDNWNTNILPCFLPGIDTALLPYSETTLQELQRIEAVYVALSQQVRALFHDPAVVERLETGHPLALEG